MCGDPNCWASSMIPESLISRHQVPGVAERKASLVVTIALVMACALCLLLFWWSRAEESRALRSLPDVQRRALYEGTLHTLTTVCDPAKRSEGLERFCDQQADLLVAFQECDPACQDLVGRTRSLPRR